VEMPSQPKRIEFKIAVLTYKSSTDLRRRTSAISHVSPTYQSTIAAFCRHQSPGGAYQLTADCW